MERPHGDSKRKHYRFREDANDYYGENVNKMRHHDAERASDGFTSFKIPRRRDDYIRKPRPTSPSSVVSKRMETAPLENEYRYSSKRSSVALSNEPSGESGDRKRKKFSYSNPQASNEMQSWHNNTWGHASEGGSVRNLNYQEDASRWNQYSTRDGRHRQTDLRPPSPPSPPDSDVDNDSNAVDSLGDSSSYPDSWKGASSDKFSNFLMKGGREQHEGMPGNSAYPGNWKPINSDTLNSSKESPKTEPSSDSDSYPGNWRPGNSGVSLHSRNKSSDTESSTSLWSSVDNKENKMANQSRVFHAKKSVVGTTHIGEGRSSPVDLIINQFVDSDTSIPRKPSRPSSVEKIEKNKVFDVKEESDADEEESTNKFKMIRDINYKSLDKQQRYKVYEKRKRSYYEAKKRYQAVKTDDDDESVPEFVDLQRKRKEYYDLKLFLYQEKKKEHEAKKKKAEREKEKERVLALKKAKKRKKKEKLQRLPEISPEGEIPLENVVTVKPGPEVTFTQEMGTITTITTEQLKEAVLSVLSSLKMKPSSVLGVDSVASKSDPLIDMKESVDINSLFATSPQGLVIPTVTSQAEVVASPLSASNVQESLSPALPEPSVAAPPLPKSSVSAPTSEASSSAPPLPKSPLSAPPLPGLPLSAPIPESSLPAPPLPGLSLTAPVPESTLPAPPLPNSSLPAPPLPKMSLSAPPLPKSSQSVLPQQKSSSLSTKPDSTVSAPPLPSLSTKPESTLSAPPLPSLSLSVPLPKPSLPAPPLPKSSLLAPPLPEVSLPAPPLPKSSLSAPPLPSSSLLALPLPNSTLLAPPLPKSTLLAPPLPKSTLSTVAVTESSLPAPPIPGLSLGSLSAPLTSSCSRQTSQTSVSESSSYCERRTVPEQNSLRPPPLPNPKMLSVLGMTLDSYSERLKLPPSCKPYPPLNNNNSTEVPAKAESTGNQTNYVPPEDDNVRLLASFGVNVNDIKIDNNKANIVDVLKRFHPKDETISSNKTISVSDTLKKSGENRTEQGNSRTGNEKEDRLAGFASTFVPLNIPLPVGDGPKITPSCAPFSTALSTSVSRGASTTSSTSLSRGASTTSSTSVSREASTTSSTSVSRGASTTLSPSVSRGANSSEAITIPTTDSGDSSDEEGLTPPLPLSPSGFSPDVNDLSPDSDESSPSQRNFDSDRFAAFVIPSHSTGLSAKLDCGGVPDCYGDIPLAKSLTDVCKGGPLIGLEYVVEVRKPDKKLETCYYICAVCSKFMNASTLLGHIKSVPHRLKFSESHHPNIYEKFGSIMLKDWTSELLKEFNSLLMEAEGEVNPRQLAVANENDVLSVLALVKKYFDDVAKKKSDDRNSTN